MYSHLFSDSDAIDLLPRFCRHLFMAYRRSGMNTIRSFEKVRDSFMIYCQSLDRLYGDTVIMPSIRKG